MAFVLAAIGAGGKTSLLRALAQALPDRRVLLTTTTHIHPVAPPDSRVLLIDPDDRALLDALASPGVVCAGSAAGHGKIATLAPDQLDRAVRAADVTLCEADGAHRRLLKLHRPHEPVLPPHTTRCVIVAGLSALGRPVGEVVHCFDRDPDWAHDPQQPVTLAHIARCVHEAAACCGLPPDRLRVLLHQADTPAQQQAAAPLVRRLADAGLDCRAGSLRYDPAPLVRWLLS
ncbi:MAG: selenium cofactor biosynthesis protein YqeC [Eubacteriales bacterium]|nr:selenium cofactor biosynthesis protein YqeC [Eubacteriales bacterium]